MLGTFNTGIWESFMELLFTSCGFPCLTDILYRVANYDCLWRDDKGTWTKTFGTEWFPQHNMADLNPGTTFYVFLSQQSFYGKSK